MSLLLLTHPEWRQVDREGKLIGRGPLEKWGWQFICLNAEEYIDYVCAPSQGGTYPLQSRGYMVRHTVFNIRKGVFAIIVNKVLVNWDCIWKLKKRTL